VVDLPTVECLLRRRMPPPLPDAASAGCFFAGHRLRRWPPPPPASSVCLPSSSVVLQVGTSTTARRAVVVPLCRHCTKILRWARAGRGAQPVVPARHGTKWRHARRARAASCPCRLVPMSCRAVLCWAGRMAIYMSN
jgi:hypothetical protein